jgi:hypothetical protein
LDPRLEQRVRDSLEQIIEHASSLAAELEIAALGQSGARPGVAKAAELAVFLQQAAVV